MTELEILVQQFQSKNQVAFKKLYSMYSQSIHGVVYSILKDADIADEIMQDMFI